MAKHTKREVITTITEREINGVLYEVELAKDVNPEGNIYEFEGEKYAWIIKTHNSPPRPPKYQYEAFTREIIHLKREEPIFKDHKILEFNAELSPEEITELEAQLGKTIRKINKEITEIE